MAKDNQELLAKIEQKNGNGNGEKQLTVADQLSSYLGRPDMKQQLMAAATRHITPDRIIRVALTMIRMNPDLLKCTMSSLVAAILTAIQLGLEPGILGHCYFVPFNRKIKGKNGEPDTWIKEVTFIIGYRGLIDLARRSGQITTIAAFPIYSKDKFECVYGFEQKLFHEPNFGDRGELIGFYSYALTKDGGRFADVMSLDEVKKVRDRSKAKDNGPWVTDFEEMGRKTVLRRMSKYLPMSIEWQELNREDEDKEFADATAIELNLGGSSNAVSERGTWPTIENHSPAPLTQADVDSVTQKAQEKLTAKRQRKDVPIEDIVSQIPPGAGDGPGVNLYDDANGQKFGPPEHMDAD